MSYYFKGYLFALSVLFGVCGEVVFYEDGGYFYPPPPSAPPLEEPPLLPPQVYIPTFSEPTNYLPPINDVFPPQLPPNNDDTIVVPSRDLLPPEFRVENMSCTQGLNFKATFRMTNDSPQFPVVDEASEGCIISISPGRFKIDLENNKMVKCGVKRCQNGTTKATNDNMCVMMRIPTVRGVRLPEDAMVTLMCTPQERVVSQTRHVKLGSNNILQSSRARSNSGFVATGGMQKDLKTRIGIFRRRPGSNTFDQTVQGDTTIQLGEELVLRATVNEGDGWQSSQIGPVVITGLNSKKSALLINQQGCVNPVMRSICPRPPLKINPLSTELRFRAFLFQESSQGDEMVVSTRTQGCLRAQDCIRAESCMNDSAGRSKRGLAETDKNSIRNWESLLAFKVEPAPQGESQPNWNTIYLCFSLLGLVLSVTAIILALWLSYYRKNRF